MPKQSDPISRVKRLKLAEALWGWVPTAGQARIWLSEAKVKVPVCGRRFGKTEVGALDDVTAMLVTPHWSSMVVAPSNDQVMINYKEARDRLEGVPDLKGSFRCRETPHPEIIMGDRSIMYRTAGDDGKYIRGHGKKIRRIRVDEAAYVKQSVVEGVIEPMCLDCGAEVILQGTPFGKNYFYLRFLAGCKEESRYDGSTESFHYPTLANIANLDAAEYERKKHQLGADSLQWKCEYLAEFVDAASAVFGWDLIESCFYDPADEKGLPKVWGQYIAGIDLARYSDYTVVTVGGFDRGQVHVCDLDRFNLMDWVAQKARIYDLVQRYKAVGAVDATGEGDAVVDDLIVGEYAGDADGRVRERPGLPLEKVRITTNQIKRDLIDKLQVRMSQGLMKFPFPGGGERWQLLVDELKYYSYTMTDSGRVTFAADAGYHDDIVMSLALLAKKAFGQFEARQLERHNYAPNTFGYVCEQIAKAEKQGDRMIVGV